MAFYVVLLLAFTATAGAQEAINLYPGVVPNATAFASTQQNIESAGLVRRIVNPSLEIYLPAKENASGAAVIICPGGSYKVIVFQG